MCYIYINKKLSKFSLGAQNTKFFIFNTKNREILKIMRFMSLCDSYIYIIFTS